MSTQRNRSNAKLLSIACGPARRRRRLHRGQRRGAPLRSGHGPEGTFMRHSSKVAEADGNGDGAVDAAEWNALFAKLDADSNGKLEDEELARHHGAPPPEALAFMIAHHADDDRDGKVTSAEWKARVAELDDDRDGALTAGELSFRHRSDEADATLPPFAAQWDTDSDGRLGASELDALFAAADDDGDGALAFKHRERNFDR